MRGLGHILKTGIENAGFAVPENAELVRQSDRPDLSDFQSNVAMAIAKIRKINPAIVATRIFMQLISTPGLSENYSFAPVGGFINIKVSSKIVGEMARYVISLPDFGVLKDGAGKTLVIDYGGPNVAKALHAGHLRTAIIGEALKNLARFKGCKVIGDTHLGDWGLPMGMLIAAIKEKGLALPLDVGTLNKLYPEASKRSKEDDGFMARAQEETKKLQSGDAENRAIWKSFVAPSVADMKKSYDRLGVEFDLWLGESDANDDVNMLVKKFREDGLTRMSDGAEIIDLLDYPMNGALVPPFIVVKSNGAVMYDMTDVGTLYDRLSRLGADMVWYVVDSRQSLHFHQVFSAAKIAGIAGGAELEHLGYGTINGKDGKPFKTRSGETVRLEDLLSDALSAARARVDENEKTRGMPPAERDSVARAVGVAAVKFADLINPMASDYVFDADRFTSFEGKTGPYVLYTAVRIKSMLREAKVSADSPIVLANGYDKSIAMKICEFSDAVDRAFDGRAPNVLAQYAYDLAVAYNAFYHNCHVLSEPDAELRDSWLALSAATLKIFGIFAGIIKITIPERM
jgi:arginyl-tRNA synthetase